MTLFPPQRLSEILRICLHRRDEQLPPEHGIKEEGLWNNLRQVTIFLTGAFAKNKSGDIPRPLMRSTFTKQLATSFNKAKGETSTLPSAALLFYCRTAFTLLKDKVAEREKWMTAQIQKMLVPKLKATAKQFASSSTVTHPTVAIENMTDNIKNVFGEFILGELKELHNLVCLSEMTVDGEVQDVEDAVECVTSNWILLEDAEPGVRFVTLLRQIAKCHGHPDECQMPEKADDWDVNSVKDEIKSVEGFLQDQYATRVKNFVMHLDFYLQCSWLVSVFHAVMVHPSVSVFKGYMERMTYKFDDDETDEKVQEKIRQIGRDKMNAVEESARLLAFFRYDLIRKCHDLLGSVSIPQPIEGESGEEPEEITLVDEITRDQRECELVQCNTDEYQLSYTFPREFSSLQDKRMYEIVKLIESLRVVPEEDEEGES